MRPSTVLYPPTWPAGAGARGALDDPSTRILLIEDHELVAVSLAAVLESEGFLTRISLATSMESTLQCAADFLPDVVLLDLYLGECGPSGIDLVEPLKVYGSSVIVLTGVVDRMQLARAAMAGADAILGKGVALAALVDTIERCVSGNPPGKALKDELLGELRLHEMTRNRLLGPFQRLTPRERDILAALAAGSSAREIAIASYVSLGTVRSQIHSLLVKLGVGSQHKAVAMAHESGWLATHLQESLEIPGLIPPCSS
ncbi:MAG: response regulator transcription factor [Acidimicrobiales bacterium]